MLYQEVAITESPQHADTRQSGIGGSLNIHIAIAHIDGIILLYPKRLKGCKDGVWSGFLADAGGFMLADSHLDGIREEMAAQFLGSSHHLVAHHSDMTASLVEFCKHLRDTLIGSRRIERMLHIVLSEGGEGLIEQRIVSPVGNGSFHQLPHPVAYKASHIVD